MSKAAYAPLHVNDNCSKDNCFAMLLLLICKYGQIPAVIGMCLGPICSTVSTWDYFRHEAFLVKVVFCILSLMPGMLGGAFIGMIFHLFFFDYLNEPINVKDDKCQKQSQKSCIATD